MQKTIGLVEDEQAIADNYRDALVREGYAVQLYATRAAAQAAFAKALPDLAILDIQLGDERDGGHQLCTYLRSRSATLPIVFLTALDSDIDEIVGLKLGADEYLAKTVSLPVMTLRVAKLIKRHEALRAADTQPGDVLERGPLRLDLACMTASWNGRPLELTVSEFQIVECLARYPGQVRTRDDLMNAADKTIEPESVNSYIKRIRRKVRAVDPAANPVQSKHSLGYLWVQGAGG